MYVGTYAVMYAFEHVQNVYALLAEPAMLTK
jgi:hypothetical protein